MIEGWAIFHIPGYLYVIRRRYGHGLSRVYVRGAQFATTLEAARELLPQGRRLERFTSRDPETVEVWFTPSSAAIIRTRTARLRDALPRA